MILPTGESVKFDTENKTIVSGVLQEVAPLDGNRNRERRQYAQIEYYPVNPKNILIRVNARGSDPRDETTAEVLQNEKVCLVPSAELFSQSEGGSKSNGWKSQNPEMLLFPTDASLNAFLQKRCGMSFL